MRNMIKTFAASALIFGVTSIAYAADVVEDVPAAPEAQDSYGAPSGWEGAYGGVKGTYQWGKVRSGGHYKNNGFGVGAYGGYNLQSGKIVYGGEADLNYSGADSSSRGVTTKQGLNGSIRGRVGYDLDPALVYGTAGLAATSLKASDATSSERNTLVGVTVGAGVETKLTDSVTARAEYRFTNYQTQTFGLDSGNVDRSLKEHQLNVGVGMRF